jgi:DNA repair exonuclease SbcCD ATPase subunit
MMNKFLSVAILTFILGACTNDNTTDSSAIDSEEFAKLQSENRLLQSQLNEKDSVLNESIMLFNEIEENLAKINLKEDEIRFKSQDVELAEDGKEWILQEIQNINYLREANQKKIKSLNAQLKSSNGKISELEKLIASLTAKIEVQDQEIDMLRAELSDLDKEYVELLEAYQEQSSLAAETIMELNTAYYAYGSFEELEANGVLVKEGGFIGIGKKTELNDNFNEDYFTKIDITQVNEIEINGGKKVKLISDHPSSAYSVKTDGTKHMLTITDAKRFWKVSKYLVAVTD